MDALAFRHLRSCDFTQRWKNLTPKPIHNTPSSDVYSVHSNEGIFVLKALRQCGPIYEGNRLGLDKKVDREMNLWLSLSHPNILPISGLCTISDGRIAFVSHYMEGGDALSYVGLHPDADFALLCGQIAEGTRYLHDKGIVHGDLKGTNVVIDISAAHPKALICDFGCSRILGESGFTSVGSGTIAWTAKELLIGDGQETSKASDIWSLGMTIYELYTQSRPYQVLNLSGISLMQHIARGELPSRPADKPINDALWSLLLRCWSTEPEQRPLAADIRDFFGVGAVSEVLSPFSASNGNGGSNDESSAIDQ